MHVRTGGGKIGIFLDSYPVHGAAGVADRLYFVAIPVGVLIRAYLVSTAVEGVGRILNDIIFIEVKAEIGISGRSRGGGHFIVDAGQVEAANPGRRVED